VSQEIIEALRAENERLKVNENSITMHREQLIGERDQLQAKLSSCEADVEYWKGSWKNMSEHYSEAKATALEHSKELTARAYTITEMQGALNKAYAERDELNEQLTLNFPDAHKHIQLHIERRDAAIAMCEKLYSELINTNRDIHPELIAEWDKFRGEK
jgi:chromosome segregation ATPase